MTALFQGQSDVSSGFMPSSDPTSNLIPNKPKDFTAFVNLVDFCRYFLVSDSFVKKYMILF